MLTTGRQLRLRVLRLGLGVPPSGGQLNDGPEVRVRRHDQEDDGVDVVLHPVAGLRDRVQNGGLVRTAS